jgi:transposase
MARRGWGGRKHRSRGEVERILCDYERREQTAVEFANSRGIKPETLRWWLRRRREEGRKGASPPRLVPVRVRETEGGNGGMVEVVLANGRKVRVGVQVDAQAVARLVTALERPC